MKYLIAIAALVAAASLAGTARQATAAEPAPACAESGQKLPTGTTSSNTVLVYLTEYDSQGHLLNGNTSPVDAFHLRRYGRGGKKIPVKGRLLPGCWMLLGGLPYFGRQAPKLCVVLQGPFQAQPDKAHPSKSPACPVAVFDKKFSGFFEYHFTISKLPQPATVVAAAGG